MVHVGSLAVTSPTIAPHAAIPRQHAQEGDNLAPHLVVTGIPAGTVELAIICHDPDAPLPEGFTHWTVYGIPPVEGAMVSDGPDCRQGPNSSDAQGWTGPHPPVGHGVHHYYFWAYALRRAVSGAPSREVFLAEYADAVIEQARLVGVYER